MIRSADLLINRLREGMAEEGQYAIFIITEKGRASVTRIFGAGKVEPLLHGLDAVFIRPTTGEAFLKDLAESDVDGVYTGKTMPYIVAMLNARHLLDVERARLTTEAVHAYFSPRLAEVWDDDESVGALIDMYPWGIMPHVPPGKE